MRERLSCFRPFLLALGFLSRLAPPLAGTDVQMSRSVMYYPAAGAVIGLVQTLPFCLGLFAGHSFIQAWAYTLAALWVTRALHLDGLADVLDALGSGKKGDAFRSVLKDSRLGAFGAAAICLAITGYIVLAEAIFAKGAAPGALAPLFFAPVFGRCLPILLAITATVSPHASLGKFLSAVPKTPTFFLAMGTALGAGVLCLSLPALALSAFLAGIALLFLTKTASANDGYNGDYFGFLIICGELSVLAGAAAF